jgi:hypothetical protein
VMTNQAPTVSADGAFSLSLAFLFCFGTTPSFFHCFCASSSALFRSLSSFRYFPTSPSGTITLLEFRCFSAPPAAIFHHMISITVSVLRQPHYSPFS